MITLVLNLTLWVYDLAMLKLGLHLEEIGITGVIGCHQYQKMDGTGFLNPQI
jgi:hypothetical protein